MGFEFPRRFKGIQEYDEHRSGFSIGGFYDIPLTESIYFEPGLSLFYNTIGLDEIVAIDADGEQTVSVDGSVRNFGFRVPLVAGYRFEFTEDIAVSFFTARSSTSALHRNHDIPARREGVAKQL